MFQTQLASQYEILIPQDLIVFNTGGLNYDCREDEASMQFVQLVITETVSKVLTLAVTGLGNWFVKGKILKKKDWRPVLSESEEIVWVLYYQVVIWFSIFLFPYISILQPFLIYVLFMSYYIFLTKFAAKPISQSNRENTGVVISVFQTASMLVWIAAAIGLFAFKMKHEHWLSNPKILCGPFPN